MTQLFAADRRQASATGKEIRRRMWNRLSLDWKSDFHTLTQDCASLSTLDEK
jgi:hypothetical protein